MVKLLGRFLLVLALSAPSVALAQEPEPEVDDDAAPTTEEPDPTRLDVERLPPEAIPISRDLYAHGFFLPPSSSTAAPSRASASAWRSSPIG